MGWLDGQRTAYHWQHCIARIQRKPGALRNGAPFSELSDVLKQLQRQLMRRDGGDRLMAQVLAVVPKAGLEAAVVAVELLLEGAGSIVPSAEHVINSLTRLTLNASNLSASAEEMYLVTPLAMTNCAMQPRRSV